MIARSELDRFYDGPAPEDADAALACGGWTKLARLRARQASLHCDAEARLILARRRRARLGAGDPGRDRAFETRLAAIRAAALALCGAATPGTHGEI